MPKILLSVILMYASIVFLGALITLAILQSRRFLEIISLSFPLGLGTVTSAIFVLSWLGVSITAEMILSLIFAMGLGLIGVISLKRRKLPINILITNIRNWPGRRHLGIVPLLIWITFSIILLSAIFLAIGRSYSTWDAMAIWSVKGYGIAKEGTIFAGATWGSFGLEYPLNIPIAISIFKLVSGDVLPGSKLIFPIMFGSLLIVCYLFWRRQKIHRVIAGLGVVFLASNPLIFQHATLGYANLTLTVYLVTGALYTIEGFIQNRSGHRLIGGIFLGFAVWTRPEGFILSGAVSLGILLSTMLCSPKNKRNFAWLIPLVVISITWISFLQANGITMSYFHNIPLALQKINAGDFNVSSLYKLLRFFASQALDPNVWGLLFPLGMFAILFDLPRGLRAKKHPYKMGVALAGLFTGLFVALFYYVLSFGPQPLEWWLQTGFNRMMLPSATLFGILAVLSIRIPDIAKRKS